MAKNGYTTLNLPSSLVEELKIWRMAFSNAYGKAVSYGEMIRSMLDSMEDSNPSVVEELTTIVNKHPELMDKMANYNSLCGQESQNE